MNKNKILLLSLSLSMSLLILSGCSEKTPENDKLIEAVDISEENLESEDSKEEEKTTNNLDESISIKHDGYKIALNCNYTNDDQEVLDYQAEVLATSLFTDIINHLDQLDQNLITEYPELTYDNIYKASKSLLEDSFLDSNSFLNFKKSNTSEAYYMTLIDFKSKHSQESGEDDLYIEIRASYELEDKYKDNNYDAYMLFEINIM